MWRRTIDVEGYAIRIQHGEHGYREPELLLAPSDIRDLGVDGIFRVLAWFLDDGQDFYETQNTICRAHISPEPRDLLRIIESEWATQEDKKWARDRIYGRPEPESEVPPPPPLLKPGVVYILLAADGSSRCKIGRTRDLPQRMKQLAGQVPFATHLLHAFDTDHPEKLEALLHERFSEQRLNGEWFSLTEADLAWIEDHCETIEAGEG